jgi:hypothetical protein
MQVVKRAGVKGERCPVVCLMIFNILIYTPVDKLEQMLGSYGPHPKGEAYTKDFEPEESPSGMIARSGSYNVRSRVIDDDGEVYAGLSLH